MGCVVLLSVESHQWNVAPGSQSCWPYPSNFSKYRQYVYRGRLHCAKDQLHDIEDSIDSFCGCLQLSRPERGQTSCYDSIMAGFELVEEKACCNKNVARLCDGMQC